jgi:hypothetical protein
LSLAWKRATAGGKVELQGEGEGVLVDQHRQARGAGDVADHLDRHGGAVLGDLGGLEDDVGAGLGSGGADEAQGVGGGAGVEGGAVEVHGQRLARAEQAAPTRPARMPALPKACRKAAAASLRPPPSSAPTCRLLFEQADAVHRHALVDGLAHVVDGEQADLHGGEGFHLDAGAADGFGGDGAADGGVALDAEVGGDAGEEDRVAQGIRSAVRLAPWMAAMRAMPITSPFLLSPARMRARVAGCITMRPSARATRRVSDLAETSTMWAWPWASKWVRVSVMGLAGWGRGTSWRGRVS